MIDKYCKNVLVFIQLILVLGLIGYLPANAETTTIKNTNNITKAKADSVIAATKSILDMSGYGFYEMVCQDGITLHYRLFKPATVPNVKYPLVITLHGSGPEGTDNIAQMAGVGPTIWGQPEYQAKHPHYSVCPQASQEAHTSDWKNSYAKEYKDLRDTLIKMYPDIDSNRIYLTGFSAGASITFRMLAQFPTSFAAGIPASGTIGGKTEGYAGMSDWPPIYVANNTQIWIFGGGQESINPDQINGMNPIADSITAHGGTPHTTFFPNLEHSEVEGMYKLEPGLFDWLFEQKRVWNTDVKSDNHTDGFQVFYNSASDIIEIKSSNDLQNRDNKIQIYSILGIKVLETEYKHSISAGTLSNGIYFVVVGDRVGKFVKM
ncbi:MAG: T9SS type A sorting domain-containing protein [bacterium]